MENATSIPVVIKLMIVLVFIDVTAMMLLNYLDTISDPDIDFFTFENFISFIFPLVYLAGMVWFIMRRASITKIIIFIVFALELAAFLSIDFEFSGFDFFAGLSLVSVMTLLGCIYIIHTDTGKRWFVVKIMSPKI